MRANDGQFSQATHAPGLDAYVRTVVRPADLISEHQPITRHLLALTLGTEAGERCHLRWASAQRRSDEPVISAP